MAGILSIFMVLGVLFAPLSSASDDTSDAIEQGSLDIVIPRDGKDAEDDAKPRQMRYFRVDDDLSEEELKELAKKYDTMSASQVAESLGQEGVLTEPSTRRDDGKDIIKLRGVDPGNYILKETAESAIGRDYRLITIAWNSVTGATTATTLETKTKEAYKPLEVRKYAYDKEDANKTIDLEGVHFVLLDEEENEIALRQYASGIYYYESNYADDVETTTDLITNEKGQILVYGLPEGDYTLRETQTIEPYIIDVNDTDDTDRKFKYDPAVGHFEDVVNSDNPNKGQDFDISLIKRDGHNNETLAGAKFKLYLESEGLYTPVGLDEEGYWDIGEDYDYTFTTDEEGKILIEDLPDPAVGSKYVFREVEAPEGYILDSDTFHEAKRNDAITVNNYKSPEFIKITLNKQDSISKEGIDRVGFELFRVRPEKGEANTLTTVTERVALTGSAGKYEFREDITESDQVFQLYTDGDGQIEVNGLPDGQYYFRENEPADNYDLAENRGKESERLSRHNPTHTMTNRPINPPGINPPGPKGPFGSHKFIKVDDSKEQKRLANAVFSVYTLDDKGTARPYVVDGARLTVKSGANGEFEVDKLPYGKYVLRETAAPAGHVLDVKPIPFEISKTSSNNKAIMIVNKRTPDKPVTPPGVTPPNSTPPGTTTPPTTRTTVPPVTPPGKTYYVPKDTPGIPRGPLVKTGDIRIIILVTIGIVMIIGGSVIVKKSEKEQKLLYI